MAQAEEPSIRTSITPPWGTPFTTEQGNPEPQFIPATGAGFQVLVEQNTGTSSDFRWSVTAVGDQICASRAEARAVAEGTARRFSPNHPFNERHRSVYRVTPDEYLVVVQGMTKAFHFRVVVAELIT
jgi:sarcosine oxidase gamma subunit